VGKVHIYSRLNLVKGKIEQSKMFLEGIESGEHPEILKRETEQDLLYWQTELNKLTGVM
jgi:hypothetical protein